MTTTLSNAPLSGRPRLISLSRTGRWLLVSRSGAVDLHDLLGTMPARRLPAFDGPAEFVGGEIWALDGDALARILPRDLKSLPSHASIPGPVTSILAGFGEVCSDALISGAAACRITVKTGEPIAHPVEELADGEQVVALYGSRIYVAGRRTLRALDRRPLWKIGQLDGDAVAASVLFGGRSLALLLRGAKGDVVLVLSNDRRVHQIAVPRTRCWAVAEQLGHAFLLLEEDQAILRVDLRYGRIAASGRAPFAAAELAVDQDGRHAVLASVDGREIAQMSTAALLQPVAPPAREDAPSAEADETRDASARDAEASTGAILTAPERVPVDALVAEPAGDEPTSEDPPPAPRPVVVPDDLPLALGTPLGRAKTESSYATARAHLDALLEIVAARTALAIATAWNSGRLSPNATRRPYELEVEALLGGSGGFAVDKLEGTLARMNQRLDEATVRASASSANGTELPFPALVHELQLSDVAAQIVLVVAAPGLSSEIARLYSVLSNDSTRPLVDRALIEQIVAGDRTTLRDQIACELAADATLVRHGVILVDVGQPSLFSGLAVSEALLYRLCGLAPVRTDATSVVRSADTSLDALQIPAETKRELVIALAAPTANDAPLRLVVRGRRGSGRHSVVAALAARIGREIVAIDMTRFPRGRFEVIAALRTALFRARMHGFIPVLSGLELLEPTETELREAVYQVLRQHPGPVVVRTTPEADLPMDPGYVPVTLPPLLETERARAWHQMLAEAGLTANADHLAARYRIGPGVIRKVLRPQVARSAVGGDVTNVLDDRVRQHVASRLQRVAKRVERTARWEDVALPEDSLDSLREFIGRAHQRRTVYETWGYDEKLTSARGLTALFYGLPGTGKTMVAGVIAKELGLELYQVDLARVVSKWVGETEKNLAEVFDAAEEGQVLILFDEADSLFAKRTDVRTSNDRYANLEVNYLLQRLDTFEGVAILTSNLDGAIDPAFKRRLSLRLQFPFPDEETRVRLWAGHVTSKTPTAGDFDFPELARKFPLSGGYIRNCVLRAAFLAAHDGRPMRQDDLLRAVQLEYREMGKLSTSSRLE